MSDISKESRIRLAKRAHREMMRAKKRGHLAIAAWNKAVRDRSLNAARTTRTA
ncbi:hypothetical protein ACI2KR_30530 [Pseudomonas luteola]